jgi:predicted dienelactone hydrolase
MKTVFLTALCTLIAVSFWTGQTRADGVGFIRLTVADPMGGKMLVSVWYPTQEDSGTVKLGPYSFAATRDAPPSAGQRGLVVMSHGTEGSDLGHRNIAIALAQQGIIAAAPLHPRDNFKDNSGVGHRVVMEGRPLQVRAVIDALVSHDTWGTRIDPKRIGAFGFSLGGYTMLAVLGAQPDMMLVAEHCEAPNSDPFCLIAGSRDGALRAHVAQEFASPLTGLADVRLCAASIVDPVAVPFSDAALTGISTRHVQVWRPEHENVLSAKAHASRVVGQLNLRENAEPTSQIVVTGAQHYSFLAPFPWRLNWTLPTELTQDSKGFDRGAFQARFANEVSDFLVRSLEACPRAH